MSTIPNSPLIRKYEAKDKEAIFSLVRESLNSHTASVTAKVWDWLFINNPFNPDGSAHILVSEIGSDIIGLFCNIFVDLKVGGEIMKARWGCNFMTHPKHRGKGIRLFRQEMEIPHYPFLGFPNKRALDFEVKMGFSEISSLFSQVLILDMKSFLYNKIGKRFVSFLAGAVWNSIYKLCFSPWRLDREISITKISSFDDRFNRFWQEVSYDYPIIVVRNAEYLNWRFVEAPFEYHIYAATQDERILGYIVLRQIERGGLKRGIVVDLLTKAHDGKTLKTLLVKAITYFKENRCVVAETPLLTSRKIYYKALCRFGFLIKRFRIYFDGYAKDEQLIARIKDPDNWFITAADPDLDIWET